MRMNLYSIRDRLIDYFMVPFPAPSHSQVKAAIAQQVNNGDTNAISQAPHQFEIWQLAEIDTETGSITEHREYLCDCSSLIRRGLREGTDPRGPSLVGTGDQAQGGRPGPTGGPNGQTGTQTGIPAPTPPPNDPEAPQAHPETGGILEYPPNDERGWCI